MISEVCVTLDGEERKLTVSFEYEPPSRGARGRWGDPMEPDSAGHVSIYQTRDKASGEEVLLTFMDEQKIEFILLTQIENDFAPGGGAPFRRSREAIRLALKNVNALLDAGTVKPDKWDYR